MSDPYDTATDIYAQVVDLETTDFLLFWDGEVMMPEGGIPARASQRSTVTALKDELLASERLGEALEAIEETELTELQQANVREIRREHRTASRIPAELSERIGEFVGEAGEVWKQARADDDWEAFAPSLEQNVELRREWGKHANPAVDPYVALWEEGVGYHSQPYVPYDTVDRLFDRLRARLVPLIEEIRASDVDPGADVVEGEYDETEQMALARDALSFVGLDWERARLDTSTHPFSYGTQFDARVTTRFDPAEPFDGLLSTLHEFGHTDYTQGLPRDEFGLPTGNPRGLAVHESQSRLWENHVGRSRAFWEAFLPTFVDRFPRHEGLTVDEVYGAVNRVREENLIRVEADELTYHLHIILRTEIERELMSGDLDVADVPQEWNAKMDEYLGVVPETDTEGCLQDIHWSKNLPGFISYTVGSVIAAQLWNALESDIPDVDQRIADGEFDAVHSWLEEQVHQHGQRYTTSDLVERATGEPITADPFLDYVESKFTALYDL
ncbi:MAG: carboxypeptidase M32 [Halolamina sp.]|uniref:carboxypeptidase M32 n=1 Tax=Halolamina sp. TaxID=1940283 RepID=UPI002FC3D70D